MLRKSLLAMTEWSNNGLLEGGASAPLSDRAFCKSSAFAATRNDASSIITGPFRHCEEEALRSNVTDEAISHIVGTINVRLLRRSMLRKSLLAMTE